MKEKMLPLSLLTSMPTQSRILVHKSGSSSSFLLLVGKICSFLGLSMPHSRHNRYSFERSGLSILNAKRSMMMRFVEKGLMNAAGPQREMPMPIIGRSGNRKPLKND